MILRINKKFIFKSFLFFFWAGLLSISFSPSSNVYAQSSINTRFGLDTAAKQTQLENPKITTLTGSILGTVLSFIGVIFFIILLVAGIMWMFDRGNEDRSKKALSMIFSAIVGIIVVMGAYAITSLVLDSVKTNEQGSISCKTLLDCPGNSVCSDSNICVTISSSS